MDCYLVSLLTLGCCAEASCEEEKFAVYGEELKGKRRGRRDSTSWLSERTNFHPNSLFIRFLSEQMMYIIHEPYSNPCMTLGYLGEATRRFRVRFPGGDKCRHVCLQRIKSENFLRHFHYELTSLLRLFYYLIFFYCVSWWKHEQGFLKNGKIAVLDFQTVNLFTSGYSH